MTWNLLFETKFFNLSIRCFWQILFFDIYVPPSAIVINTGDCRIYWNDNYARIIHVFFNLVKLMVFELVSVLLVVISVFLLVQIQTLKSLKSFCSISLQIFAKFYLSIRWFNFNFQFELLILVDSMKRLILYNIFIINFWNLLSDSRRRVYWWLMIETEADISGATVWTLLLQSIAVPTPFPQRVWFFPPDFRYSRKAH